MTSNNKILAKSLLVLFTIVLGISFSIATTVKQSQATNIKASQTAQSMSKLTSSKEG